MIKIGVGLPAYGSKLDVGHATMWFSFGVALASMPDRFSVQMFANYHIHGIDLCRNLIVSNAVSHGCDWVFMVDADTFHDGHNATDLGIGDVGVDILQMIQDGDRASAAMIGAPVRGRGIGRNAICVERQSKLDNELYADVALEEIAGKVVEVDRLGGAFIAVNLKWLQACWPVPPWFRMEHGYAPRPRVTRGEDHFFCDGVRDRGGKILCDARFVPSHVDRRKLVGEDS